MTAAHNCYFSIIGKLVPLLLGSSGFLALACGAWPLPTHDYIFSVTGVVTSEDGAPLEGAEVTIEMDGPVYKAVELVKIAKLSTNNTGGFVFMYTSHERGVKYSITVRKEGFEQQTASGSAPPSGNHTIHLKKRAGIVDNR
jgi:hypothetical protein